MKYKGNVLYCSLRPETICSELLQSVTSNYFQIYSDSDKLSLFPMLAFHRLGSSGQIKLIPVVTQMKIKITRK